MSTQRVFPRLALLAQLHPILPPVYNPIIFKHLESLWIVHVRCLLQAIHEIISDHDFNLLPDSVREEIRSSVHVVINNMVDSLPRWYVVADTMAVARSC
jgi:hypothetical protein